MLAQWCVDFYFTLRKQTKETTKRLRRSIETDIHDDSDNQPLLLRPSIRDQLFGCYIVKLGLGQ